MCFSTSSLRRVNFCASAPDLIVPYCVGLESLPTFSCSNAHLCKRMAVSYYGSRFYIRFNGTLELFVKRT